MKKFLRISWGADSTPLRLLGSVLFAFAVMIFVNVTIGGFGGIPIFIAFAFVFYLIRAVFVSGNRINHFLAMDSGKELRYLYVSYGEGFLLFYLIMKLVLVVAKINGWGNATGITIQDYFLQLYGTSIMERWAYIFTFVFTMGFVLTLFPLLVAKDVRAWVGYAAADFAFHALLVLGIVLSCMPHIRKGYRGRVKCLLDGLLLCNIRSIPRITTYLIVIGIYIILAVVGTYLIAKAIYRPRPGKRVKKPENFLPLSPEEIAEKRAEFKRKALHHGIVLVIALVIAGIGFVYYFFISRDNEESHLKVGEWLTEDLALGPIRYGTEVFIPVDRELSLFESGKSLGYLGEKDENTASRYYRLAIANILYQGTGAYEDYLQVHGQENHVFLPASLLEQEEAWKNDEFFLLWDEDWSGESLYTEEATGYSVCKRELIEKLEEEFGQVLYDADDFEDYDAYFTLNAYDNMKDAVSGVYPGDWVGCILVKDDRFYYGNYDNEITGETREMLMEALGGAE